MGSGQLQSALAGRPPNVEHVPWVEYEQLQAELHPAGCALGIFGTSEKAERVIPNKAFQAIACGTPLVTADTPAARELLAHEDNALLVPSGNPEALAALSGGSPADRRARRSGSERRGRATYRARASEAVLGARWRGIIDRLT